MELHLARYFSTFGRDLPPDGLYERMLSPKSSAPLLAARAGRAKGNQIRAARAARDQSQHAAQEADRAGDRSGCVTTKRLNERRSADASSRAIVLCRQRPVVEQPRWRRNRLDHMHPESAAATLAAEARRRPRRGALVAVLEIATVVAALAIFVASWLFISRSGTPATPADTARRGAACSSPTSFPRSDCWSCSPGESRRRRAAQAGAGSGGRLHVRLVAIFSIIAAVPTLLVVIFASLLFQYGVAFWFSDSARTVLENADRVAQAYVNDSQHRLESEMRPMATDFHNALSQVPLEDPRFPRFSVPAILRYRNLNELALIGVGRDNVPRCWHSPTSIPAGRSPRSCRSPSWPELDRGAVDQRGRAGQDRVPGSAVDPAAHLYLYASRQVDPVVVNAGLPRQDGAGRLCELARTGRARSSCSSTPRLLVVSLLIVAVGDLDRVHRRRSADAADRRTGRRGAARDAAATCPCACRASDPP